LALSDQDKEQIKFNTEIIKVLVLVFLATGGGAISLILQRIPGSTDAVFSVLGMIVAFTVGIAGFAIFRNTQKLIEK